MTTPVTLPALSPHPLPHSCRPRLRWGTLLAVLLLGLAFLYLAREPLLIAAARALTLDAAEAPADYLVVL